MSDAPKLTDRKALDMHRARIPGSDALFLHEEALADVQDRVSLVKKEFHSITIISPFPEVWRDAFPNARLIDDTDVLDLTESSCDLIVHAMALHWANDPVGQLIQCRRALKPDGLLLVVMLGGQTLHELRASLGQAESDVTGGLSPRVAPMGEIRDLGALLQRAGLALPVADSAVLKTSYASPLHLMRDLRAMGETNALHARIRSMTRRDVLLRAAQIYVDTFADADGRVPATFELITLTGWAPDASQPQPLRPGSASQRLADALNTVETPLKD
ncbi:methyltransferase domain-containing protein [Marivita hallyeonensis]|uniref:Methyltransferase domain-containing protein n=1 Tax=Marivita hallyeonensis TaxID=996342 RepID=A0A1M5UBR1_9RHOB|nr:methyltransferase domain-containing protein [Marivita hallyeonensis]SHH60133.1 Methyltransferase domain-containing protein [Marivita hallyeonensis]